MSDIENRDMRCEDCAFANIYEDASEYMRHPDCFCSKDHEIIKIGFMKWIPEHQCLYYQEGEPEYI
jgi:hypothetical protein